MKRIGRTIVAVSMAFLAFTMTVFAEPSASQLRDEKTKTKQKIEKLESEMTSVMRNCWMPVKFIRSISPSESWI